MRVGTNLMAMSAQKYLDRNVKEEHRDSVRLASGERLFQAALDPSGLAISEKMRSYIRSREQAQRNASDSISLLQLTQGALSHIQALGIRMREIAVQGASDSYGQKERGILTKEFEVLKAEVGRVLKTTQFNDQKVLLGKDSYDFQVGIHGEGGGHKITYDLKKLLKSLRGVDLKGASVLTKEKSFSTLARMDRVLENLSKTRASLGAFEYQVNTALTQLQQSQENQKSAHSRIRDADMAKVSSSQVKAQLKREASTQSLLQGNRIYAGVEKLLD